eukprot:287238-Hanusia_phi.AAC.1
MKQADRVAKVGDEIVSITRGAIEVLLQSQGAEEADAWLQALQKGATPPPLHGKVKGNLQEDGARKPPSQAKGLDPDEGVDVLGEILGGNSEEEYDPAEDALADAREATASRIPAERIKPPRRRTASEKREEQPKSSAQTAKDDVLGSAKRRSHDEPSHPEVDKQFKDVPQQAFLEPRNGSGTAGEKNQSATALCGVGMVLEPADPGPDGFCEVRSIKEGGSVWCEGKIRVGDLVLRVDDLDCRGVLREEIKKRVLGREGTELRLQMFRKDHGNFEVKLIRSPTTSLGKREKPEEPGENFPSKKQKSEGREETAKKAEVGTGKADARIENGGRSAGGSNVMLQGDTPFVFALFASAPGVQQEQSAATKKTIDPFHTGTRIESDQNMRVETDVSKSVEPRPEMSTNTNLPHGKQEKVLMPPSDPQGARQEAVPTVSVFKTLQDCKGLEQLESYMMRKEWNMLSFEEMDKLCRKIAELSKIEKIDPLIIKHRFPETYRFAEDQIRSQLSDKKRSPHQVVSMIGHLSSIGWDGKLETSSSLLQEIVKMLSKFASALKNNELVRFFSSISSFSCAPSVVSSPAGWSLIKKVENSVVQMNNFDFLAILDSLAVMKLDMSMALSERACDRLKRLLVEGRTDIGMDRMVRFLLLLGGSKDCARSIEVIRLLASKIRPQGLPLVDVLAVLLLLAERDITLNMATLHELAAQLARRSLELLPSAAAQALWALCSLEWRDGDSEVMETLLLTATRPLDASQPDSSGSGQDLSSVNAARLLWVFCRLDMQERARRLFPVLERRIVQDPSELQGRDITDLVYSIEKLELNISSSTQQEISRVAVKFVSSYSSGELAVTLSGLTYGGYALCDELVEAIPLSGRALGRNFSASTAISILQALASRYESPRGTSGGHRMNLASAIMGEMSRMLDRCDTQQVAKVVDVLGRLQLKVQQEVEISFLRKFLQLLDRYSAAARGAGRAQPAGKSALDFHQSNFQREYRYLFLFARASSSLNWESPLQAQYLDMLREVTLYFARSSDPSVVLDMYVSLSLGDEVESCFRARFPELMDEGDEGVPGRTATAMAQGGQRGGSQLKGFLNSLLKVMIELWDRMQAKDLCLMYLLLLLSAEAKEEARSSTWNNIFSKVSARMEEIPARVCCKIVCSLSLLGVIPSMEALSKAIKHVANSKDELSCGERSNFLMALAMLNQTQFLSDFNAVYEDLMEALVSAESDAGGGKMSCKNGEDIDMFDAEDEKEKERKRVMRERLSDPHVRARISIMALFSQTVLCNNDKAMEDVWKITKMSDANSREVELLRSLLRVRGALSSRNASDDAMKFDKFTLERFYLMTSFIGLISPEVTASFGEEEKQMMEKLRTAGKKSFLFLQDALAAGEGGSCLKEISETAAEFGVELQVGKRDEGVGFWLPLCNDEKKVILDVVRPEDEIFSPEEIYLRLNGSCELRKQILTLSGWSILQVRLSLWELVRDVNVEKKKFLFRADRLRKFISAEFEEESIFQTIPSLSQRQDIIQLLEALLCVHDGFVRMDASTACLCLAKLRQQQPLDHLRRLQEVVFQSGLLNHCSSKLDDMDSSQRSQLFSDVICIWNEVGRPRSRFPTSLMSALMKLSEEALKAGDVDIDLLANMCSGVLEAREELANELLSQTLLSIVNRCKEPELVKLFPVDLLVNVFACTYLLRSLSVGQNQVDMRILDNLKEKLEGSGSELRTRHVQQVLWWMNYGGDRNVNFGYKLIRKLQRQVEEMRADEVRDVIGFHAQLRLFLSDEMGLQIMDRIKQLDILEALSLNDCVLVLSSFTLSGVEEEDFALALLKRIDLLERSHLSSANSSNDWNVEMEIRFLWCCVAMQCLCEALFRHGSSDSSERSLSSFSSLHTRCRFRILERFVCSSTFLPLGSAFLLLLLRCLVLLIVACGRWKKKPFIVQGSRD